MTYYVSHYIEECTTNDLSVVVLDTQNNDKLVAAVVQKDITYAKPFTPAE
jgi:hypothetical protein